MYILLCEVKSESDDWDVLKNDNEKRSAELSQTALEKISIPYSKQKRVFELIMATKWHSGDMDRDCQFFVDSDLAILGMGDYDAYSFAIRKEYEVFSDEAYFEGRKKVISYFLKLERIYQSDYFYEKFEKIARTNLKKEKTLS